jgi:hypothetical protein
VLELTLAEMEHRAGVFERKLGRALQDTHRQRWSYWARREVFFGFFFFSVQLIN